MENKLIVIIGTLVTGFSIYGTFESKEEAEEWANNHVLKNELYIISTLYKK